MGMMGAPARNVYTSPHWGDWWLPLLIKKANCFVLERRCLATMYHRLISQVVIWLPVVTVSCSWFVTRSSELTHSIIHAIMLLPCYLAECCRKSRSRLAICSCPISTLIPAYIPQIEQPGYHALRWSVLSRDTYQSSILSLTMH